MRRRVRNITEKHRQLLNDGGTLTWNRCWLRIEGDRFRMWSPKTGTHTLLIITTDTERLAAHWHGFAGHGQA